MTSADDIVKARRDAAREAQANRVEDEQHTRIEAGVAYLSSTIPTVVARLEQLDYPDAQLTTIVTYGPKPIFGQRKRYAAERAAWLLDEDRWSEGHSSLYLLADGCLAASGWSSQSGWNSGPIDVRDIPAAYSAEGATSLLDRAVRGIKELAARYGMVSD